MFFWIINLGMGAGGGGKLSNANVILRKRRLLKLR